jgi:hypothetical protein
MDTTSRPEKQPDPPNPFNLVKALADGILVLMLLIALSKFFL